jgi:hypothetical protein
MNNDIKKLLLLNEAKDKFRFSLRNDLNDEKNLQIAKFNYDAFSKLYEKMTNKKLEKSFEDYVKMAKG